jgi:nucleoside-diphosphate-sugar epimerase
MSYNPGMTNPRQAFRSDIELDEALSKPAPEVIEALAKLTGDILILGAGGKMGPSLARMARRASDAAGVPRRVIAVSRFTGGGEANFNDHGVETIRCDLLNENDVARLPEAASVVFMTGRKFGSTGDEAATWAMNSYLPGIVCRKFHASRIVAFSTGNVYGLSPVSQGGSREDDVPKPVGEYAMSCLGRERVFEHFSRSLGLPTALVRLNYACDLRYGVLVDLAERVWNKQPVDVTMGYFNTIWQGDANGFSLRAFNHAASPPWVVNVTGTELLSVRAVCDEFGRRMHRPVRFEGVEAETALVSHVGRAMQSFGPPRVTADQLIGWLAQWVMQGGTSLDKPTHFESRTGKF